MKGQQTWEIAKDSLLEIIRSNREKHLDKYKKARIKFEERAVQEMEKSLALAKEGKKFRLSIPLTPPTCHTEQYDNVIGLLELSKNTTVFITADDYRQYVKDEWTWKAQWAATNSAYLNEGDADE